MTVAGATAYFVPNIDYRSPTIVLDSKLRKLNVN